jgi:hypothetical protein
MRRDLARVLACSALALSLAPAGCQAPEPATYAVLETRALAPAAYEAEVVNRAVRLSDLAELGSRAGQQAPVEVAVETAPGAEAEVAAVPEELIVDLHVRIVTLEAQAAERALGWSSLAGMAVRVERAAGNALVEELVQSGLATEVNAPRLSMVAGRPAYISISNQVAYLERFELVAEGTVCAGDPEVGVAEEGLLLTAWPDLPTAGGLVPLELELVLARLEAPMHTRSARLPGVETDVSLQAPLTTSQKLSTAVLLAPDDLLVLGGVPAEDAGRLLFVFATCEVLAPEVR